MVIVLKIKKPEVNYLEFRFSKLNTPEYKHLWLLLGWVWYLTMYVLTENLIPPERCHEVHSIVDDVIPFNANFILAYCSWYFLIVGSILYFMLYDVKSFVRMQKFIIATQVIGIATCIFWPSIQYLRPAEPTGNAFCVFLVKLIYGADTPTGVCPSLHVGYSLAILSAWLKREESRSWWKAVLTAWVLLISISVCFVKQHSFTDVWAAGIMCALIEMVMFRRYWKERLLGLKAKLTAKEITEG